jgi:hypothetical protein
MGLRGNQSPFKKSCINKDAQNYSYINGLDADTQYQYLWFSNHYNYFTHLRSKIRLLCRPFLLQYNTANIVATVSSQHHYQVATAPLPCGYSSTTMWLQHHYHVATAPLLCMTSTTTTRCWLRFLCLIIDSLPFNEMALFVAPLGFLIPSARIVLLIHQSFISGADGTHNGNWN